MGCSFEVGLQGDSHTRNQKQAAAVRTSVLQRSSPPHLSQTAEGWAEQQGPP